jgi:tetratricopeptide (TPR) repeat protein
VLHGSVRRSGNRIRVSAQLIKVADESQLWSERYDREMRDVFDIQDEIAQRIVEKLKVHLDTKAGQRLVRRYTENPEVHSLYLRGIFHMSHLFASAEEMEKSRTCLEQVVAAEPGHAPAWVQLADYYIAGCFAGRAQPRELWPRARNAASRAVLADPEFADAQAAVGVICAWSEHKFAEAISRVDAAVRLNPASARAHLWRSQVQLPAGRAQESLESARRAVDLDPLFPLYRQAFADRLLFCSDYEGAAEQALQLLELERDHGSAYCILGDAYSRMGRHEEGVALLEKGMSSSLGHTIHIGFVNRAYVAAGRRAGAERFVAALEEKRLRLPVPAATIAFATLGLGDLPGTLRWIEQAMKTATPICCTSSRRRTSSRCGGIRASNPCSRK